jgi:hypothetical protein
MPDDTGNYLDGFVVGMTIRAISFFVGGLIVGLTIGITLGFYFGVIA